MSPAHRSYDDEAAAYNQPICRYGDCQAAPIPKTLFCASHTPQTEAARPFSTFISPIPKSRLMAGR